LRVGLRNRHWYGRTDLETRFGKSRSRLLLNPPDGTGTSRWLL